VTWRYPPGGSWENREVWSERRQAEREILPGDKDRKRGVLVQVAPGGG